MASEKLDLRRMQSLASVASELMKVLANRDRLLICWQLSQQEMYVSELEKVLRISQPTLSQQLTVLRKADLVTTHREGKNIVYALTSTSTRAVMEMLFQHFSRPGHRNLKK